MINQAELVSRSNWRIASPKVARIGLKQATTPSFDARMTSIDAQSTPIDVILADYPTKLTLTPKAELFLCKTLQQNSRIYCPNLGRDKDLSIYNGWFSVPGVNFST